MRRSAAPSLKTDNKRPRFITKLLQNNSRIHDGNDQYSTYAPSTITKENDLPFTPAVSTQPIEESKSVTIGTNENILKLILDEDDAQTLNTISETREENVHHLPNVLSKPPQVKRPKPSLQPPSSDIRKPSLHCPSPDNRKVENENKTFLNCLFCTKDNENASMFNVMWCKRSSKKHKTWEGDGMLIVKSRSAVLKDLSGKVLDRGMGYKLKEVECLEDGSKFCIGGKECEIQSKIPTEEIMSGKYCKCSPEDKKESVATAVTKEVTFPKISKKFHPPTSLNLKSKEESELITLPEYNFILTPPSKEHQMTYNKEGCPLTDVRVDVFLTKQLRYHQKEGIDFMYRCIMGFQHEFGEGVILADEMGLGKTLQCIALIWTLMKCGPYGGLPVLRKVIIITPSSLVTNWQNEFHKWLTKKRLDVFAVNKKNTVKDYVKSPKPVLIISYEMFLRSSELLSPMSFDLVVCDEGHRIKNINIKISNVVNCLSTTKRILLTGTPIQNDLKEFFSIVDFVNPGALGSIQYFCKTFERPISLSRNQDCSEEEKQYGEERSEELNSMTKMFMLRRTQDVINQYLPQKTETVVFCRPSEQQVELYNQLLSSRAVMDILSSTGFDTSTPLVCISILRKLCNHPSLLQKSEIEDEVSSAASLCDSLSSLFSDNYHFRPTDSGKMRVLECMLSSLFSHGNHLNKEKVVIVSCFTKTLDILERFCKLRHYEFVRLDGSTNTSSRQEIVDTFNYSYTKYKVFLLSSKAGGVGFNLIGASRIILYDLDWNPANDLQAMARIWRDGQKRAVFVYRLLTTGTIEEKMFQRQLSKQCLSGSVLDANASGKLRFSKEELKDLFTFHDNTRCITHDLIKCKCLTLEHILNFDEEDKENDSKEELKNAGMAELMTWNHICGPISSVNCSDPCLISGGSDITFLFQNTVNMKKKI